MNISVFFIPKDKIQALIKQRDQAWNDLVVLEKKYDLFCRKQSGSYTQDIGTKNDAIDKFEQLFKDKIAKFNKLNQAYENLGLI